MTHYVRAVHWDGGWELHIADVGVTQTRLLKDAQRQVTDYLDTLEIESGEIDIRPDLGGVEYVIEEARHLQQEAQTLQEKAAIAWRESAHRLHEEAGLSVTDTATLMGVSRGRVSQLLAQP